MVRVGATATLLFWGCTHASATPPRDGAPSGAPAANVRPAASAAASAPAALALELTPEGGEPAGQISITEPASGELLSSADALRARVRVDTDHKEWLVELGLDGARARPLSTLPSGPTLSDLNEGRPLSPGEHFVVAALRESESKSARFAIRRFSVGAARAPGRGPIVYCGRPSGTYYGAGDGSLLFDFAVDGFELGQQGSLLVRASELGSPKAPREARLESVRPMRLLGIASHDWRIELSLLDKAGKELGSVFARHRCELTVNEVTP